MSTNKFEYWPTNGQLGSTKFTMPTNAEDWPSGDALVGNFVYKEGELVDFIDTKALIVNDSKTTTINYDYVNIELPFAEDAMTINRGPRNKYLIIKFNDEEVEEGGNVIVTLKYKGCKTVDDVITVDPDYLTNDIVDGVWSEGLGELENGSNMFMDCYQLTSFNSDLSNLTYSYGMFSACENLSSFNSDLSSLADGSFMFARCYQLTSFSFDLPSLTNSNGMFTNCTNLESFSSDLSSLTSGEAMFNGCSNLTSFNVDLSSLTFGVSMFSQCKNLTSWNIDLPSLTNGRSMFGDCPIGSFSSDLSSLTNGYWMFGGCENLTSFSSDLSSLTNGDGMFTMCKLDTESVMHIADTINTPSSKGKISIGIGNSSLNSQEEVAFNKIASKNWTVYVGRNGSSKPSEWEPSSLIPIDSEEQQTPIPFWAKPVPSDEHHARYIDENGNFYNILGGNYIYGDDLSTYGMFTSEEDAAANMRLTKIEKSQRFA